MNIEAVRPIRTDATVASTPEDQAAVRDGRLRFLANFSRQEVSLLAWGLCIALLCVAISIVISTGPIAGTDLLLVGISVFGLGAGAGISVIVALRLIPQTAVKEISKPGVMDDVFENAPNGIAVWDQYGHLIRANAKYCAMLQIPAAADIVGAPRTMIDSAIGKPLSDILSGNDGALRVGKTYLYPLKRTLANGEVIETLLDVTALTEREQALIKYEDEAKELVKEFTAIRTETDELEKEVKHLETSLAEERIRADAATRAKKDFLSHMSHELRTPLNAIIGFTEMMRGEVYGPLGHDKYREYAQDIHESGEMLLRKVSDIMDVSQVQSGDLPTDRQRLNLEEIIEAVLDNMRPQFFTSKIALLEDVGALPTVFADAVAVRQILVHVLNNALRYTPQSGRVSIKAECDLNNVTLIVDDTGIGIPAEVLKSIDKPLSYTENDATIAPPVNYGMGIGIAVSKSLARINGGCLTIDSQEGYGTTVRLTLPRR